MVSKKSTVGLSADPTDPDDFDVSEAEVARALEARRKRGRPAGGNKEQVTLRLDKDVLAAFKAGGEGWQTRINDALRKAVG
jgi:uncharacterized protein (DUF4415 family)